MRYVALLLLIAAPSVFSLSVAVPIPFISDPGSVLLLLSGLLGVVVIRRRQQ
ncbi:MAG: PEP-CTERM sorting domain-containing protein [Spongiibacteraceae bacterium]